MPFAIGGRSAGGERGRPDMPDPNRIDEFLRLFMTHELRLRAYAMSLIPNHADAEDVLQESNLLLWKKFDQFVPGTSFMSWAGRVVYLEAQQKRRRQRRDKLKFGDDFFDAVSREATSEAMMAELRDRERALGDCVAKLRPEHRQILQARYDDGASIERIAALFDRSSEAIYNALSRIRKAVGDCVSQAVKREV